MSIFLTIAVLLPGPAQPATIVFPADDWQTSTAADAGMDDATLRQARDYALTGGGTGMIARHGRLVLQWGDVSKKYDLKSTSKSIGITALGLAIADGRIRLTDKARKHHPTLGTPPGSNAKDGWLDEITILHLATQTAGFDKRGGYEKLLFRPGTSWHYSDCGPNWLAECVTLAYKRDIEDLLFERVFTPIGITTDDLHWRRHHYRDHKINGMVRREFGSGVHANVNAMARVGYLYLRRGRWKDRALIPEAFVARAATTVEQVVDLPEHIDRYGNASGHYGLLWWNNADGAIPDVPRDAYWSWGLYDSLIVVIPSLDIVASRAGKSWHRKNEWGHYDVLKPFLQSIVASLGGAAATRETPADLNNTSRAPYPPSHLIRSVEWAPRDSIVRAAGGSDNWPVTWGDDDSLYTAYGDGWGFQPGTEKKLSLGFARVTGGPLDFRGANIRSESGEAIGQGSKGRKASGLLMVDGILYCLVRNVNNSQLGWSRDHGVTWTWSEWKFSSGFGCPTFLNYGPDYSGSRDDFVYIYSPDSNSAYKPADRMVLARVRKDRIRDRKSWEVFVSIAPDGNPVWSDDFSRRGSVFNHPSRCYRTGITYNAGLQRYLWCQVLPESRDSRGPRFEGGFGIYDAPEPWGPWTTVFFTEHWDVGPGETCSLPTKWMSDDGRTVHLLSSTDDCFSVRRARLLTVESR